MKTKNYKKSISEVYFYPNDFASVAAWHHLLEAAGIPESEFDTVKEIIFDLDPDACECRRL